VKDSVRWEERAMDGGEARGEGKKGTVYVVNASLMQANT